jgi:8-oxo-dGTP pyrophosphatase MutT (NUDIX family)
MEKEFVSSVYIIKNDKVLLIFHQKLQKWLPPGGHLELNETPCEAARREVKEETGLDIEFLSQSPVSFHYWNAKSIECPYLCLLEEIPAYQQTPAHQHVDFIFIGKPLEKQDSSGLFPYQWFDWNDLKQFEPDRQIFQETLLIIKHILEKFSSPSFQSFPFCFQVKE